MKIFNKFTVEIQFEGKSRTEYVTKDSFIIGRSKDADIFIDSKNLSRQHIKITIKDRNIYIEDQKSTNGCFLDSIPLEPLKETLYSSDCKLTLGKHEDVILKIWAEFIEVNTSPSDSSNKASISSANDFFKSDEDLNPATSTESKSDSRIDLSAYTKDDLLKKPDSLYDLKSEAEFEDQNSLVSVSELKKSLDGLFTKDPMSLKESAPKKAETEYKDIMNKVEILRSEIIKRAENRADKILKEAQKKSEALLDMAKSNSDFVNEKNDLSEILKTIESKKSDLEKINLEYQQTKETLNSLDDKKIEFKNLVDELISKQNEIKDYESKLNSMKLNFSESEKNLSELDQKINIFKKDKAKFQDDISKLEKDKQDLLADIDLKNKSLTDIENKRLNLQTEIAGLSEKRKEVADLSFELSKILDQTNTKKKELESIDKSIENANAEFSKLKHETTLMFEDLKNRKSELSKESEKLVKAQKDQESYILKNKNLLAEIEDLTLKKDSLLNDFNKKQEEKKTLDKEVDLKIKNAKAEADLIISQAMTKAQSEALNLLQKSKKEAYDNEQTILTQAKAQAAQTLEQAKAEVKTLLSEATLKSDDLTKKSEEKADKLLKDSQARADELRDKAQAEYKRITKEAEVEADRFKVNALQVLDEKKKDFVELEKKRMRKSAELLKSEISVLLFTKLKLYLKDDTDESLNRIKSALESAINASMLQEVMENDQEMYALLDDQVLKQQKKNINYWRYTVPGVICAIIVTYFAIPFFKNQITEQSRKVASVSKKVSEERIKEFEEESRAALFEHFSPKKTSEFLDTYTDRVLYTEGYAEMALSKDYREDWILDLQTFFVEKLELSENALVPFISQEANMIKELVDQSKRINGKFIDQGIAKMREIESDFLIKLKSNLNSDEDYKKITAFQKKFFKKKQTQTN